MSPNPLPSPPETLRLVGPVIRQGVRRYTVWLGYTPRSVAQSVRVIRHLRNADTAPIVQACLDLGGYVTSIDQLPTDCILIRKRGTVRPVKCYEPTHRMLVQLKWTVRQQARKTR
jgi:hypothetical protein